MKDKIKQYFREQFSICSLKSDLLAGVIVALVSIPISMGYAQVAGLPPVYGLYGSLLPILVFGLISSSRQFVVGVDAMPAAMVGAMLSSLGIAADTREAMEIVPIMSFLVAVWFILFYLFRAGRIVKYISNPVMGGFITGVGLNIIMMQIPKLFGGNAGCGEVIVLVKHIVGQVEYFNPISALLGVGCVVIILVSKKLSPMFPMSVILMIGSAILAYFCPLQSWGVRLLPQVEAGLPKLMLPRLGQLVDLGWEGFQTLAAESLLIALVVMAQSLLASNSYGMKYDFKLNSGRELLGYSAMNAASCLCGCCPVNGSVSRTGIADQFGAKSHVMSLVSGLTIGVVLVAGTPILQYLPVPVLTGIVMGALIGILDIKQAKRLWKSSRQEFWIFMLAMAGVLLFGTIYGVVLGMVLSFFAVIVRAVIPPTAFLGQIPGHDDFYNLKRNKSARPIKDTIIYRFGGNLFFANVGGFVEDIEREIEKNPTTRQVIVDARGIGNIDITAADRLLGLRAKLEKRGIRFYLTEHVGSVNDSLREYGAGELLEKGAVRRTISLALRDAGVEKPYPLVENHVNSSIEEQDKARNQMGDYVEASERLAEFEWAFGEDAEREMELIAHQVAEEILQKTSYFEENPDSTSNQLIEEAESHTSFGKVGLFDEDELLDYLEIQLEHMNHLSAEHKRRMIAMIGHRRLHIQQKLAQINPKAEEIVHAHRLRLAEHWRESHPEEYERILEWENKHLHWSEEEQES